MKYSETCRQLIMLAYDPNPGEIEINLGDALSLYQMLLEVECLAVGFAENQKAEESVPEEEEDQPKLTVLDPEAGAVEVVKDPATPNEEDSEAEPKGLQGFQPVKIATISGRGAVEKRRIYRKLLDYRARHGLGCLNEIAALTKGRVSVDEIRMMLDGAKVELTHWQTVGTAIETLEAYENEQKANQRRACHDADPSGTHDPVSVLDEG